ncbi:MAG: SpoIID/LytB domain-containing protein [Oscillospiraceae bacterium]|nr:SpoIID/LytB domain-containing protein [Oscillospiraceae bacterium]
MQVRTRRNRIAILVAGVMTFTATGVAHTDRNALYGSPAVDVVYAATTTMNGTDSGAHAVLGPSPLIAGNAAEDSAAANDYNVTNWWKADISEYDQSLSLISYETASAEQDPLLTTTAVTTTTAETTATTVISTYPEPALTAASTIQAMPDTVVFYSSGYGHGVGMSQNGANFYARYDGWNYQQILSHYYPGTTLVNTGVTEDTQITIGNCTGDIVSVIAQIVNREMGPSMAPEALKAQAIAIYSFYLYHGHGSGLRGKANPSQNIIDAVRSVLGTAVYYNNAPADTMFYASSGGATASCKDIFFMDIPYLVSVPVKHDETCDPYYNEATVFSTAKLKRLLESAYNVDLKGNPYDWMQITYGDGGYVASVVIGGTVTVKGNSLREVLGLRSPKFEFVYQPQVTSTTAETATNAVA